MAYIEMFPESVIALMEEVAKHQDLLQKLSTLGSSDFFRSLEIIATHLDVLLDGSYTPDDVEQMCERFTQKLREKRAEVLVKMQ